MVGSRRLELPTSSVSREKYQSLTDAFLVFSVTYSRAIWTPFGRHGLYRASLDSERTPVLPGKTTYDSRNTCAKGYRAMLVWRHVTRSRMSLKQAESCSRPFGKTERGQSSLSILSLITGSSPNALQIPSGICFDYAAFLRRAGVGTSMTTG
jgi:hypothetical protein